jgi:hypothetical protein
VTKPQKFKKQINAKYSVVVGLKGAIILYLWTEWMRVKVTTDQRESQHNCVIKNSLINHQLFALSEHYKYIRLLLIVQTLLIIWTGYSFCICVKLDLSH